MQLSLLYLSTYLYYISVGGYIWMEKKTVILKHNCLYVVSISLFYFLHS